MQSSNILHKKNLDLNIQHENHTTKTPASPDHPLKYLNQSPLTYPTSHKIYTTKTDSLNQSPSAQENTKYSDSDTHIYIEPALIHTHPVLNHNLTSNAYHSKRPSYIVSKSSFQTNQKKPTESENHNHMIFLYDLKNNPKFPNAHEISLRFILTTYPTFS